MDSLVYLHALHKVPHIGPTRIRTLLAAFGTPEAAWKASRQELSQCEGWGKKLVESFLSERDHISPEAEWEQLEQLDIRIVPEYDPAYPALLKEIPSPPYVLYTRGNFDLNRFPLVTIVGSRRCTDYGFRVARQLASDLASAGVCVVSGMAFGIDAAAHRGALDVQGPTVAVLGNSLDDASLSPQEHLGLAHTIIKNNGLLLSEYPPVTAPTKGSFPARNRIMAGMSLGTVVVEAARRSGTLITSRLALEFNRDVFAVPGSIFSEASSGPHQLLRSGAKIVTGVADILEELRLNQHSKNEYDDSPSTPQTDLSSDEQALLAILSTEPLHIDKILKLTTLDTSAAGAVLAFLEMKGLVKNLGGMHYIKT